MLFGLVFTTPLMLASIGSPMGSPTDVQVEESPDSERWSFLPEFLEAQRAQVGSPGMTVAVGRGGKIVAVAAAGVRALGDSTPVEVGDRFHIGSVSKPMTATLVASLIEEGQLDRGLTLAEALPEQEMRDAYRDVTIEQLLQHRGGVQPYLTFDEADDERMQALPGAPREQRAAFLAEVLAAEPIAAPGERMNYSNAGYVLVAHVAEVVTDRSYEDLMRARLFEPLELESTGFGWPATPERKDQPLGHMGEGTLEPQPIGGWDVGAFLAPAGDLHSSAADLARFGLAHVRGLAGDEGLLKPSTFAWLHEAPPGGVPMPYACGWFASPAGDWHPGSAGSFFAQLQLLPDLDACVVVLANSGSPANFGAAQALIARIGEALRD